MVASVALTLPAQTGSLTKNIMEQRALPRTTAEAESISAQGIENYLDTIRKSGLEYHSIMILRNGKVAAEQYYQDYTADKPHPLYSVSKVITGIAAWFAINEGLFGVHDKLTELFPDKLPEQLPPHVADLEVYHLLTMTVGHNPRQLSQEAENSSESWIKLFLSAPVNHKPGTVFEYNNLASYMLSALIQKQSGEKLIDYIYPRLYQPLGIGRTEWEESSEGINVAGWGTSLSTEDLAKIGLFLLQKGRWEDKQLLPAEFVEDACEFKVPTAPAAANEEAKAKDDWAQGYCYHVWRSRHNAFSGYGFMGQLVVVIPEKDAVIVTTGKITDMQAQLNLIWKYVLPAMK